MTSVVMRAPVLIGSQISSELIPVSGVCAHLKVDCKASASGAELDCDFAWRKTRELFGRGVFERQVQRIDTNHDRSASECVGRNAPGGCSCV